MKFWSRRRAKIIKNSDKYVVELFEDGCRVVEGCFVYAKVN